MLENEVIKKRSVRLSLKSGIQPRYFYLSKVCREQTIDSKLIWCLLQVIWEAEIMSTMINANSHPWTLLLARQKEDQKEQDTSGMQPTR